MANNVRELGKFRYIEPNDILENRLYDTDPINRQSSFNTVNTYEDYCVAVELEVSIPNRGVWVTNLTGDQQVSVNTNKNEKISFFGGDDGFLSTTPGSFTYRNILSGEQDNESLGITHIHIGYNSYYYPEVTINFTDIRGMGLMMPNEEVYREEQTNTKKKTENFFSAIFSFPSPEFKLRVKGFYGKKVEYQLMVSDIKTSFNNDTGNFDATVKFIGRMYGVYSDIPMSYLLIAPYCKYRTENNQNIWQELNFTIDGSAMPTLYELKERLLKANKEIGDKLKDNVTSKLKELNAKQKELRDVRNYYNHLIDYITNRTDENNVLFHQNSVGLLKQYSDWKKSYLYPNGNTTNELSTLIDGLYNSITNCNSKCGYQIPYLKPLDKKNSIIGEDPNRYIVTVTKENKDISFEFSDDEINFNNYEYLQSLKKQLYDRVRGDNVEAKFFVLNGIELNKELTKLEEQVAKETEKELEPIREKSVKLMTETLGFQPTIKNVFKIIMAHLQAFTTLLASCVENINRDTDRTIKSTGLGMKNLPDIPPGMDIKNQLPPFPAIKNTDDNTFCYPIPSIKRHMEETDLIDSLFIGCSRAAEQDRKNDNISKTQNTDKYFIPTCLSDFNCFLYDSYNINPYRWVFSTNKGNILIDWIMTFFGFRCIQKFMMEGTDSNESEEELTPNDFGAYEAYNFWLANPTLDNNTIKLLTEGTGSNAENFIKFLEGNNAYNITPCYKTGKHGWIKTNSSESTINTDDIDYFPACIGYTGNFNDTPENGFTFIKGKKIETDSDTKGPNSFVTNRPYGLMKEIPENTLIDWKFSICNRNDLPENLEKHKTLISKHLDIFDNKKYGGLFYSNENSGKKYTDSGWNVIYEEPNKEQVQYLNKVSIYEKSVLSISELNDKEKRNNVNLHSIQTIDRTPIFLNSEEKLSDASLFLCSIPHNIYRIAKELSTGKKIISIPYITKLFIGYIIENVKNLESEDDLRNFFDNIIKKSGVYKNSGSYELNNEYTYTIEGSDDYISGKYLHLIEVILYCLTTNENGNFIGNKSWDKISEIYPQLSYNISSIDPIKRIVNFKGKGFLNVDISGFSDEYKSWVANTSEEFTYNCTGKKFGGWKWFMKTLCLREQDKLYIPKSLMPTKNGEQFSFLEPSGDTQNERLLNILDTNNKEIQNLLQDIDENDSSKNILCYYYIPFNNEQTKEHFSPAFNDTYSEIFYDKNTKSVCLKFNKRNNAVKKLNELLKDITYFIMPYDMTTGEKEYKGDEHLESLSMLKTKTENFKSAHKSFIDTLKTLYKTNEEKKDVNENNVSYAVSTESKLSMYLTLKNLYDKHFTNIASEKEKFYSENEEKQTEIDRFHFIDTYYQDLSENLLINGNILLDLINILNDGYESGKGEGFFTSEISVYSFMALICQKHNTMLLALPIFNGIFTNSKGDDNLQKLFTPINYNDSFNSNNNISGPSYVCFYPHKASQHLDVKTSQYENDGFLITEDLNGTSNFEGPATIKELSGSDGDGSYVIPAFGVEYGSQKQSFFKSIRVNMDNPQVTEAAVAIQFNLAKNKSEDPRKLGWEGQDLFKIYSNYSYTCQVEMMGCAQIMPLMYFQLNNIPMFRGAYQIIQVEHDITPGNMTTSFRGVRINKTNIPMTKHVVEVNMEMFEKSAPVYATGNMYTSYPFKSIKESDCNNGTMEGYSKSEIGYQDIVNDETLKNHLIFRDNYPDLKKEFNKMNPCLRQLVYCIVKDLPGLSKELGYTIGIYITHICRTKNIIGSSSDHCYIDDYNPNKPSPKEARKHVKGCQINELKEVIKEEQTYDKMCCALDFHGAKNGNVDRGDASIQLYKHIACNYNKYISQLIWEMKGERSLTIQEISHVIHMASIGETTQTNKCDIFSAKVTNNSRTDTIKHLSELTSEFKEVCQLISDEDKKNIRFLSGNIT